MCYCVTRAPAQELAMQRNVYFCACENTQLLLCVRDNIKPKGMIFSNYLYVTVVSVLNMRSDVYKSVVLVQLYEFYSIFTHFVPSSYSPSSFLVW